MMLKRRDFLAGFGPLALIPVQDDRLRDPGVVGRSREPIAEADNDAVIRELELSLNCMCGCNLDIFTCRTTDFTCTYSPALHADGTEDADLLHHDLVRYEGGDRLEAIAILSQAVRETATARSSHWSPLKSPAARASAKR